MQAPVATSDRRSERETDTVLQQLRKAANLVGSKRVTLTTTGDSTAHVMWTSDTIPKDSVWDYTVEARSCLTDRSDSGWFQLKRSFVRGADVASQTRASDVTQPIGAETVSVAINANNQIEISVTDAAVATEFTAWIECR